MSNSLWPYGLQHARPPCQSPTPGVYSGLCPLSQWCQYHLILCRPLLLPPSVLRSSRVFPKESVLCIRWPKYWSFSSNISVLPMNIQDWFPWGWTGWISSQSRGLSRVFSNTTAQKHQFFSTQPSSQSNSHIHTWRLEKQSPWLDGPLLASNVSAFEYAI